MDYEFFSVLSAIHNEFSKITKVENFNKFVQYLGKMNEMKNLQLKVKEFTLL